MFGALALALALSFPAQDSAHLVVVATTDVHGHATGWDYLNGRPFPGGLARAATAIDSLRRLYPGQVVVVDAGDLIQGDPFATYFAQVAPRDPHPVIDAMNLIGYDAATPGNHEFNFGVDFFLRTIAGASFHYVSGNIYAARPDTLILPSHAVINRGGVRVGITGFTSPGVMVWDGGLVRGRVRVKRQHESMPGVLAKVGDVADFTIVLSHSGMGGASSYDTTGVGRENVTAAFADDERPPHLVVVGHTHRQMPVRKINGIYFMQPPPHARGLAVAHVNLIKRRRGWQLEAIEGDIIDLAERPQDSRVLRRLERDHQNVVQWLGEPLAFAERPMLARTARVEPTPIVNLINEVQRRRTGATLSSTAAFNPRGGFPGGDILLAHVAGLYPFENTLKAIRVTGAQLKAYLEHSARYFAVDRRGNATPDPTIPGYNFDIVSGAEYTIDLRLPIGSRIRNLRVAGRPVRPSDSFTMAINSYRQAGGGGFEMLADAPVVYDQGESIRQLLVDAIRSMGTVDPADYDARHWSIEPPETAARLREQFGGRRDAAGGGPSPGQPAGDRAMLRILGINDFHGALLAERSPALHGGVPGAVSLQATMDSVASACDCPSLRLDAGGHLRGSSLSSLVRGRSTVEIFNRLGVTASVPGPRDFGWSLDTLRQRMAEAKYTWLAANITDSATGRRPAWAEPYLIVQAGDSSVGIIGYMAPSSRGLLRSEDAQGLSFAGPAVISDLAGDLKGGGVAIVVVLAQAGAFCETGGCTADLATLAHGLNPGSVDLILSGGSTARRDTVVAGVRILEAGDRGREVAVVDVLRTAVGGRELRVRMVPVESHGRAPTPEIQNVLERYRRLADSIGGTPIGSVKFPLMRQGTEFGLGNLIADGFRNILRPDIAVIDNASIQDDLPAGVATWGGLFRVLPRQSALVALDVPGSTVFRLLERSLHSGVPTLHIAGATVRYDPNRPTGDRVRRVRLARGGDLRADRTYRLVAPDYMVGDPAWGIPPGAPRAGSGLIDVEALGLYIRRLPQPIVAPTDTRFESTR